MDCPLPPEGQRGLSNQEGSGGGLVRCLSRRAGLRLLNPHVPQARRATNGSRNPGHRAVSGPGRQSAHYQKASGTNAFVLCLTLKDLLQSFQVGIESLLVTRHQDGLEHSKEPRLGEVHIKAVGEPRAWPVRRDQAIGKDGGRTGNRPGDDLGIEARIQSPH